MQLNLSYSVASMHNYKVSVQNCDFELEGTQIAKIKLRVKISNNCCVYMNILWNVMITLQLLLIII